MTIEDFGGHPPGNNGTELTFLNDDKERAIFNALLSARVMSSLYQQVESFEKRLKKEGYEVTRINTELNNKGEND